MEGMRRYFAQKQGEQPKSSEESVLRKPKSAARITRDWALDSSCNGVPNIERSKYLRKLIWILIVLVGAGFTIYMLQDAFARYLRYEVKVSVEERDMSNASLPAITICNLNRIRKDKFSVLNISDPAVLLERMLFSNGSEEEQTKIAFEWADKIREVLVKWLSLNQTMKREVGHQIEDMLLGCEVGHVPCFARDFVWLEDKTYGNCYTFNSGREGSHIHYAFQPGWEAGVKFQLYVDQDQYLSSITESVGFVVSIHDQKKVPFPEEVGIAVPPGFSTRIGIQKKIIERKPSPYPSGCWDVTGEEAHRKDAFSERHEGDYSPVGCRKTCLQKYVMKNCGCKDGFLPKSGLAFKGLDYELCKTIEQVNCTVEVRNLMYRGEIHCECPVNCKIIDYDTAVSQALWPNTYLLKLFDERYSGSARENIVNIDIFYELLNVAISTENADYPLPDLYSDLGGNVGLFLGLSIVSLFELFELVFDLIMSCYHMRKYKQAKKSEVSQPTNVQELENTGKYTENPPRYFTVTPRLFKPSLVTTFVTDEKW